MPVSFADRIGMVLRKVPVGEVVRCVEKTEAEGLDVDIDQLQSHSLCGGHIESVVDALIFANRNGIEADWMTLCMLDLAGRKIAPVLEQCRSTRSVTFSTYTQDGDETIQGYCADGQLVRATLTMDFRLPVRLADPDAVEAGIGTHSGDRSGDRDTQVVRL